MVEYSLQRGLATIRQHLELLPDAPGVYRMQGGKGEVLYVGKAKSLKKRVVAYTRVEALPKRLQAMVAQTCHMEFVTTRSEAEALLVEASLIKSLHPKYNILLKDDKSYPYLSLDMGHGFPRLGKHRGDRKAGVRYFGPYPSASELQETIKTLQKAFLLRPCRDAVFSNRSRPCLQYHIKRCSAPCVGFIDATGYHQLVEDAVAFLERKSDQLANSLTQAMDAAAARMDYEKAAELRDRIRALTRLQSGSRMFYQTITDADVVAMAREAGLACIQLLMIREGQSAGSLASIMVADADIPDQDVISQFLLQHYTSHTPPPQLLLAIVPEEQDLVAEALSSRWSASIKLHHPKRGEKADAVALAHKNAQDALARKLAERASAAALHEALAERLGLDEPPDRIEIYDNSHTMGTHAVGAMVVAGPEGFRKNQYRKYTIHEKPGDDVGMMREVMERRFRSFSQNGDQDDVLLPDLMIIDGGSTQLGAVMAMLEKLGLDGVAVVSMAKGVDRNSGRERICLPGREPFQLPPNDPALYYMQRLRDEAHRYAIGSHRAKRDKAMLVSDLDSIPGIGPKRKKALLARFGSAKAVREATVEDLMLAEGISEQIARQIYQQFR